MKVIFLGTGAAEGVPKFGCDCHHCRVAREKGGRNVRHRTSLLFEAGGFRILVDTPPEISIQLNERKVFDLSAVLLTHEHFDHIGGLVEFEYWPHPIHIFAGAEVLNRLRLTPRMQKKALLSPLLAQVRLHFGELSVMPFRVIHHVPCYGFLFVDGDRQIAYLSDSGPSLSSLLLAILAKVDLAIFNTPTFDEHGNHISVRRVVELVQQGAVRKAVITHINHRNYTYEELKAKVEPHGIVVSYDGMEIEV